MQEKYTHILCISITIMFYKNQVVGILCHNRTIVTLIKQLNSVLGLSSIMVSHDVEETMSIADYIYVISDGEIVESGTPNSLQNSSSEWVQQFLNGYPDGPAPFHYPAPEYIQDLLVGR